MGSRAAVAVANQIEGTDLKFFVKGVFSVSYPLHPPDTAQKTRDVPLQTLPMPVLFVSAGQDEMCDVTALQQVASQLSYSSVV